MAMCLWRRSLWTKRIWSLNHRSKLFVATRISILFCGKASSRCVQFTLHCHRGYYPAWPFGISFWWQIISERCLECTQHSAHHKLPRNPINRPRFREYSGTLHNRHSRQCEVARRPCQKSPLIRPNMPPVADSVYLISLKPWKRESDMCCDPQYVGGNTSTSACFRTRMGDLIADMNTLGGV